MTKTRRLISAAVMLVITSGLGFSATQSQKRVDLLLEIGLDVAAQAGSSRALPLIEAAWELCELKGLDYEDKLTKARNKVQEFPESAEAVSTDFVLEITMLAGEAVKEGARAEAAILLHVALELCKAAPADPVEEVPAEEPKIDWWVLAFEEKKWLEAKKRASEQGVPGLQYLEEVLHLEANTNQPGQLNERLPQNGGICLSGLADRWERWILCAAFEGMHAELLAKALAHAKTRGHGPRLDRTEQFLLRDLNPVNGKATDELPSMREQIKAQVEGSNWKVHEKDVLPETISGRVVLLKGKYTLKGTMKVPSDAELWIERGVTIRPIKENSKLMVNGILRIFGPEGEPVQIGSSRSWQGLDYEGSIPNLISDVIIRKAERGLALRGASLFVTNVEFDGCVIGFQNENTSAWCDSVRFIGCTDRGFWTSVNGGAGSFLSNCTVEGNGVGAETSFRQTLWIWNCEFKKNDIPVRVLYSDAFLYAHNNNFLGRKPLLLNPSKPYDLRRNWWGQKKPNFVKKLSYAEGKKEGDALHSPHLEERVKQAGASRDG